MLWNFGHPQGPPNIWAVRQDTPIASPRAMTTAGYRPLAFVFPQDPLYLPWMLMVPKEVLSRCEVSVGLQGLVFTKF